MLYILVSLALTGMVSYTQLAEAKNPTLTTAFEAVGNTDAAKVIAFGSLVGLTTVIMVLLMGLSRVVLAMSRDGLLPRSLSKTSAARSTPARLQIICGAGVALVAGLTNVDLLEEMINIGTLSAFVMVSLGILVLRKKRPDLKPAFRVPFGKVAPGRLCSPVPVPHDEPRRGNLDLLRDLARDRHRDLLRLRPAPLAAERKVRRGPGFGQRHARHGCRRHRHHACWRHHDFRRRRPAGFRGRATRTRSPAPSPFLTWNHPVL